MKPMHTIALCGSYHGDLEKLTKTLPESKILEMSLIGREVTLKIRSEDLDEVKKSLKKLGVTNINILEWKKIGATIDNSGRGIDNESILRVSLIPSELGEGVKSLAVISDVNFEKDYGEKIIKKIKDKVSEVLQESGITDAIFIVDILKKVSEEKYINAAITATLNAIFEANGIVLIEEGGR